MPALKGSCQAFQEIQLAGLNGFRDEEPPVVDLSAVPMVTMRLLVWGVSEGDSWTPAVIIFLRNDPWALGEWALVDKHAVISETKIVCYQCSVEDELDQSLA